MPRPRADFTVPPELVELDPSVQKQGVQAHPFNFTISEFNFLRLKELSIIRGVTVTEIVRSVLAEELTTSPDSDFINSEAIHTLTFRAERIARISKK